MMKLYNSISRQLEEFEPLEDKRVKIYCCGPTVYSFVTIGNWRTYFLSDLVIRTLKYFGYEIDFLMNITDVGHLTGDNLGDADTGEDRLERAGRKENKTAWDVANFYIEDFLKNFDKLNLTKPFKFSRATDHITEQIELIKKIEEKGFSYRTSDGVYFDIKKYEEAGNNYGELSNIDEVKEGTRVAKNPEKKDPRDFALWKFSYSDGRNFDSSQDDGSKKRAMEWESPWGLGFPGWHIECSAMSMKYLGEQIDIHIGGEDLKSTHHPNEIAQSECVTQKKPFVKYWLHGAFLLIDGGRMGKSLGNAYTLDDILAKGFKPEHLRYFYLTGHYRQALNFTWENLENAKRSYENLIRKLKELRINNEELRNNKDNTRKYEERFREILGDDLQTPQVLALVWELLKSELNSEEKYNLILNWDEILGLNLKEQEEQKEKILIYQGRESGISIEASSELNEEVLSLVDQREMARRSKDWRKADEIRNQLVEKGIALEDENGKVVVKQ